MEERFPAWITAVLLVTWLAAGVAIFLPFAVGTSPLNAVMLDVPENQGNWWHVLVGAPFFLAFPMIWLRVRAFGATQLSRTAGRFLLWVAGLSACGTLLVEAPFLLHLAGTSEWQRLVVIAVGAGLVIVGGSVLVIRRRTISATRASLAALNIAYLSNALLCLVVYSDAAGGPATRSGWFVTMAVVWPMLLELVWLLSPLTATPREPSPLRQA